ncbi:NADP-dependent oxidoreductase [Flavimaricola marinus]|uniref:Phthiocerol synthesis polyketide synthase type I PpsC n=1 Tax=Flavimaricola marinus TaxID=1819565 RepID=A0A238LCZ8_9RHOB|nr:NADP-dependent oxidoreductase [Flavimaricola marinus]SMY07295.1 Phthiocerol synthesis polyketide synthase type I PpsC [Flavimaricola marinus]
MKAAVFDTYAGPVEIADVPPPVLEPDAVLIDVHAASINPIDNIVRAGHLKDMISLTFPHVLGYDVSGVITAVGDEVSGFDVGDEVFARVHQEDAGTLAEVARVKASALAQKPSVISHLEAATIPLTGLTAWQALVEKAGLQAGQKVLIHAGSGGVGTLAIQIAKSLGAFVATTVSARNAELVSSLGADLVIDYKSEDFTQIATDYDVVVDMLGGEVMQDSFKVLNKGGHLVSIKGQDTEGLADEYGVSFNSFFMEPNGSQLAHLAEMIEQGSLKPVIDSTFSLQDAARAYDKLADGHTVGKIGITVK